MLTPWGARDFSKQLVPGVYSVSTPSHGGYMVGAKVAETFLSQAARLFVGERWGSWYAFEEDCAWTVIGLEHPELFSEEDKQRNRFYFYEGGLRTVLERYYPQYIRQAS